MPPNTRGKTPILLLKTRSTPTDRYEDYFAADFDPIFLPVLEHHGKEDALARVRQEITEGAFLHESKQGLNKYGAIIFTSQRAVEAFAKIIEDLRKEGKPVDELLPETLPLYVVGPATARGLRAIGLQCPILGEACGNGEALAAFMLKHYNDVYNGPSKPPLLFLVGDKRRDIIPKTLQSEDLGPERRCRIDELVVYETGEMLPFKDNFSSIVQENIKRGKPTQWVVVFSPTGCKAMLEGLGVLDEQTGRVNSEARPAHNIFVATIGSTTRDYLVHDFGFSPDVCAEEPTAEGVGNGNMVTTRSHSGPRPAERAATRSKRKEHPSKEDSKPKAAKKQTKIEENIEGAGKHEKQVEAEMKEAPSAAEANGPPKKTKGTNQDSSKAKAPAKPESEALEKDTERAEKMASNIVEKGIIYFFARSRVGIENPESVGDLQRTYFVLRPLPAETKLGQGPIPDEPANRLFALPKKTFPKSHRDRFMAFVEKSKTSIKDLKENFFKATEYETKTSGTRRQEPVTPIAEGVYAITRTDDGTTHLAYSLTIPEDLGEVQEDLGLRSQGSFIISVKNPERPGPASARLPKGPEFPKEIIEEFRGLAWTEVKPKYLDYENAQILLIGENTEKAVHATKANEEQGKEAPGEELEQLQYEDELRVQNLDGDDTVFVDLKLSKAEYPQVPTTW
ncbi:tetrapyrrole biosynthesis, uroporphyrinogen III synthase [Westerdykella ornata]|uniref:Tetrapyrrole biosynthesis, uroporphyrinogen III synthase n=1 Tax=Westerdykella ornata TaxID=318751 RepID=A0A6A6JFI8_WESOR|nr:tetrapyrrole biosynthesis, uroporphyrinogen III synthase [Westerdykella ornata]KAF2273949.1 tetrapyrrole biosynthesis, uroporphyrinogen III synthase [Westerdykella ornata]